MKVDRNWSSNRAHSMIVQTPLTWREDAACFVTTSTYSAVTGSDLGQESLVVRTPQWNRVLGMAVFWAGFALGKSSGNALSLDSLKLSHTSVTSVTDAEL